MFKQKILELHQSGIKTVSDCSNKYVIDCSFTHNRSQATTLHPIKK